MIRLRTLGALELRDSQGQELRALLAQPKRVALLAYLAIASPRAFHPRDRLLALFWPEHDTDHARNSLNQSVHALRRALGADVVVSRNGDAVGLAWREVWCDAVAFEEALDAGRLAEALELYRGDLLEGLHVPGAPEFDRWLDAERARLASRYLKAAETFAQDRETAGNVEGAVTWWRRLATRDPYSSRVALRLMRALARSGDPAAAVQHARVHESLLREELNVAPDPAVSELVRQLETGTAAPSTPVAASVTANSALGSGAIGSPQAEPVQPIAPPTVADRQPTYPSAAERSHNRWRLRPRHVVIIGLALVAFVVVGTRWTRAPAIHSLAVLPLEHLSGDSVYRSFAAGMHDALITELARYPDLRVISRTSVTRYAGTAKSLPEIARELKVDGLVEGTLVWESGRVRMNVQLLHGPSDRHVWAKAYTRDLRDVLALQDELADAIAREVRVASKPLPRSRRPRAGPRDSIPHELHVRDLYLRGRHALLDGSRVGLETAMAAYRRAIALDSSFALAYAGLAVAYTYLADYSLAPLRAALDTAHVLARRAVALDSMSAETRSVLALTLGDAGEYQAAEREFKRAIELGPSDARAYYRYAILLVALGRGEEALRASDRAAELDPFGPQGVRTMQRFAEFLVTGQRPWLPVPVAKRRNPILTLQPAHPWAIASDAVFAAEQGQCVEARSGIDRAQELMPDNIRMFHLVTAVYWSCGERARARAVVKHMERQPNAGEHGYWIAIAHSILGDNDSAFSWLERAECVLGCQVGLRAYRWLDPLRSDPRYDRLLERLGLPRATQSSGERGLRDSTQN
ncbi:MAG TPA: BTAD domain-containing putative transcriptional regulator [Gemmatimonadaceae bacterium]|nr:BTAD domain-containing putative transcriptional regulator [Gemmatimonadaceae bacterium]